MPWWWSTGPNTRFEDFVLGRQGFANGDQIPLAGAPNLFVPIHHGSFLLPSSTQPFDRDDVSDLPMG